jgi:HPt (histidine-containing phosphotransfer) domain-containing protein
VEGNTSVVRPSGGADMSQVINMEVVEELLSLSEGDAELLVDLIQMYLQDGPHKLKEITEGLETGDYDRVERAAHSLKGSAGNLGAILVQQDCETLQQASREQSLEQVQTGVSQLQDHYQQAETALQDLLRKYS